MPKLTKLATRLAATATPTRPLIFAFAFLIDFAKVFAAEATRIVNIKQLQKPLRLFDGGGAKKGRGWEKKAWRRHKACNKLSAECNLPFYLHWARYV